MGIRAIDLPKTARKLQYDYSADLDNIKAMLNDGQNPGDGPFDTQGKARAAANSLLEQLGEDGKQYGARTTENPAGQDPGWYFALKVGRKEYKGRATAENGKKATTATKAATGGKK